MISTVQTADKIETTFKTTDNAADMDTKKRQQQTKANTAGDCLKCAGCIGYVEHSTWRKVCQNCSCPFEAHKISEAHMAKLVSDFQRQCGSASDNDSGCALEEYAWVPPGLRPEQVHQYFSCLPENRVPLIGSVGEQHRTTEFERQLPNQDNEIRFCHELSLQERNDHMKFNTQRKNEALGRGTVRQIPVTLKSSSCTKCNESIKPGQMATFAARAGGTSQWHPQCFMCEVCKELLVDLIYCYKDGGLYCGRHYAELLKPRCAACDELIFSGECTEAEDLCWHVEHFTCFDCDENLGGTRYVMRDGMPYCCNCFEQRFSEFCVTCGGKIGVDQGQMMHGDLHWHASENCFKCETCDRALLGHPFLPKEGVAYCSVDCSRYNNIHYYDDLADSANDSLGSGNSAADRNECVRRKNFEDPWVPRDTARQENFSEGYGSLQKQVHDYRRSLPDLSTCEEYGDLESSKPPLPPKTNRRAGSEHNLRVNKLRDGKGNPRHGKDVLSPSNAPSLSSRYDVESNNGYGSIVGADHQTMSLEQKCVKWAKDQTEILSVMPHNQWDLSPIPGGKPELHRIDSNSDFPKPCKLMKSKGTTNLRDEPAKQILTAAIASTSSLKTAEKYTQKRAPSLAPVREELSPQRAGSTASSSHRRHYANVNDGINPHNLIPGAMHEHQGRAHHKSKPDVTFAHEERSPRKHRTKRMSRSQRQKLAQRRCASPTDEHLEDSFCSTCSGSSGEDSELDDAYQAEVIRSDGLRNAYADNMLITPKKSQPMSRARRAKQHKTKNCSVQ